MEAQPTDDDYARLARRLPGFAGMYLDRRVLIVAVVGDPDSTEVRRAVFPLVRDRGLDDLPLRVAKAKYTYERLRTEKDRLMNVLEIEELTFAAVDEVANRIRIGVATEQARRTLSRGLSDAGVPADMVSVEIRSGFQRLSR
jgi:hypothetical protein